jgi:release factor glutamine methyltransferase
VSGGAALDFAGRSVGEARRMLAGAMREAGIDTAALDARVLAAHALRLDHARLAAAAERILEADEAALLARFAERRLAGEPVALIVGAKEFWGLPIAVTAATLIPRPETETVVEAALRLVRRARASERALRIADIGAGSGAILLALLSELPHATGTGVDISPAALAVARENARRLGFSTRAHFVATDFAAALRGGFDLVVSNPPYVATAEISTLAKGVRLYEPHLALDGGVDGLSAYRAIAADARRLLAPQGCLVVEIGLGQEAAVRDLFKAQGLRWSVTDADLAGLARALSFTLSGDAP